MIKNNRGKGLKVMKEGDCFPCLNRSESMIMLKKIKVGVSRGC